MRVRAVLIAALLTASCTDRRSGDEAAVVGAWREETADTVIRYSFHADYRLAVCLDDGPCDTDSFIYGKWWIRGDQVVYTLDWAPHFVSSEKPPPPVEEQTMPIARFKDRSTPQVPPYFRRVDEKI